MRPVITEDILELLDGHITSAAVGTALELGIFWLVGEKPLSASDMAQSLNIPLNRCHILLQLLSKLGLLESSDQGFATSTLAREAILNAYSQDTWALLAREHRSRFSAVRDLALHICAPRSTWEAQNLTPPDYFEQIQKDPSYAVRFTRALYEIHTPVAEQLARILDLGGVKRLMDLGGGSGVVSLALLRKEPELSSLVVDVENVCRIGREIAIENGLEDRIVYLPADFLHDELPSGFDMIMLCDSGPLTEIVFRKIHDALHANGRLVIVEQFARSKDTAALSLLFWAFLSSLEHPRESINLATSDVVAARVRHAGFRDLSVTSIPHDDYSRWSLDWTMIEARK